MKIRTASVVAVIVAAVLILSGIIVCAVGSAAAKSSGVMIYPEDENGNSVYKYDFTEKNITKISVSVKDSDITVTHGGTSSYIEIRNFNANYYKLSTENNILSFSEIDNVASMFKFWEGGFSFKGMRYLFRFGDGGRGMKTVTVNIADTSMLKTFSVSEEAFLSREPMIRRIISSLSAKRPPTYPGFPRHRFFRYPRRPAHR